MSCLKVSYSVKRGEREYIRKIVDENTIKRLTTAKLLDLPYKEIDIDLDKRWNSKKINAEMLQAIENGESIRDMSGRLQRITNMNKASAMRNARTMTTSFENLGRLDGMKEMQANGTILKKQWLATHDRKTRDAHYQIDGETADIDEPFVNDIGPIMYPGDPAADAANVYNCRCTLTTVVEGFEPSENYEVYVYNIGEKARIKYIDEVARINKIETVNGETIYLYNFLEYGGIDKNIDQKTREKLAEFEYKYLTKGGGLEWAMTISDNSISKFYEGEKRQVGVSIGDNIITHIHPREKGNLGGTFSEGDMLGFINSKSKTMRAVAKEGTYSITKKKKFDINKELYEKYSEAVNEYRFSRPTHNERLVSMHNWLLKNQDKYGYFYTLERRKI